MARMLLAALQQVDKHFGGQSVLTGATLELYAGARTALIGRNGAGKTTILRLLMGEEAADGGQVFKRDGVAASLLTQDPGFDPDQTIVDIANRAFEDLERLEGELAALEGQGLQRGDVYERWEAMHDVFERRGGYERRARRDMVLDQLGFRGREQDRVEVLSGGERTRLGLARILMAQPELLLLDEPTNHLDLDMTEWLEGFLGRYPGAVVIVSHDRAFLDGACTSTAEIASGVLRTFDGPPSAYREYRVEQLRIEEATRRNQHKEFERLSVMTERMKRWAGQNEKLHRRAKAMARRRDRFATAMLPEAERPERTLRFQFPCRPSGDIVLQAENLSFSVGERSLFEGVSAVVRQGQRIALVGPNGAGKTTLLKVLLGELPSNDPRASLRFGSRVRVGYYDQALTGIEPDRTLIEELVRLLGDREAHNMLGRFMFPFDAQYKLVRDLSGGERARLALLKLTLSECDFLVLDEPTNHLDVEMIEALEDALDAFEGTVLLVSHDRRFIERTCDLIWEVKDGCFIAYEGDWSFYLRKREQYRSPDEPEPSGGERSEARPEPVQAKHPSRWQLERQLEGLESRIVELEAELDKLTARLERPHLLEPTELTELSERHGALDEELLAAIGRWEETSSLLTAKS